MELKEAFDLFDVNGKGKIDPKELIENLKSLGKDKENPSIFKSISNLNTPEAQKNGGITFDEFVNSIEYQLGDNTSKEGIRRIFDSFIEGENTDVINLRSSKKVNQELGENMSDEELLVILKKVSKNGRPEITFEEFYEIMKK